MMNRKILFFGLISLYFASLSAALGQGRDFLPVPAFADPHYCGSCDPEVVWNPFEKVWSIYYTGRRPALGMSSSCGNPIGVASSKDMKKWTFRGYCIFDGKGGLPDGDQTFWAPGVIVSGKNAHMFVTYKADATPPWGTGGCIAHYVAPISDMINGWKRVDVTISEDNCLDANVIKLPNGTFRMYYVGGYNNPESKGRRTIRYAESPDLMSWTIKGEVQGDVNKESITSIPYQEGVYVFLYNKRYYMIADPHKGLSTYSSEDGVVWKYHGQIMQGGTSPRLLDWSQARHPSVLIKGKKVYIVYHVEPFRPDVLKGRLEPHQRYAFIQIAELRCDKDGIKRILN
jgi:Glycosyl hydrolases family 43